MTFKPAKQGYELAVALDYDYDSQGVPTIGAIGNGNLAQEMEQIARRYGVPVVNDSKLATQLSRVSLNQEIPSESYQAVARILISHMPK